MLKSGLLHPAVLRLLARIRHTNTLVIAAREFTKINSAAVRTALASRPRGAPVFEPHVQFKQRVPGAIGLIRTGDTMPGANLIIQSA